MARSRPLAVLLGLALLAHAGLAATQSPSTATAAMTTSPATATTTVAPTTRPPISTGSTFPPPQPQPQPGTTPVPFTWPLITEYPDYNYPQQPQDSQYQYPAQPNPYQNQPYNSQPTYDTSQYGGASPYYQQQPLTYPMSQSTGAGYYDPALTAPMSQPWLNPMQWDPAFSPQALNLYPSSFPLSMGPWGPPMGTQSMNPSGASSSTGGVRETDDPMNQQNPVMDFFQTMLLMQLMGIDVPIDFGMF